MGTYLSSTFFTNLELVSMQSLGTWRRRGEYSNFTYNFIGGQDETTSSSSPCTYTGCCPLVETVRVHLPITASSSCTTHKIQPDLTFSKTKFIHISFLSSYKISDLYAILPILLYLDRKYMVSLYLTTYSSRTVISYTYHKVWCRHSKRM